MKKYLKFGLAIGIPSLVIMVFLVILLVPKDNPSDGVIKEFQEIVYNSLKEQGKWNQKTHGGFLVDDRWSAEFNYNEQNSSLSYYVVEFTAGHKWRYYNQLNSACSVNGLAKSVTPQFDYCKE